MNESEDMDALSSEDKPTIPVSASDILSSLHGRQRRLERGISKAEFYAAVKYGERTRTYGKKTGTKNWVFNYKEGGITVVTNDACTEEITSWSHPCWGLDIEKKQITDDMMELHNQAVQDSKHHGRWNSHTVVVVDQSGSMRKTDATNGVTRSDLVWLCLAVDCIGKRLKSGEAADYDYFSLIGLGDKGSYLIKNHPMNWILYNKIIDLLRDRQPIGDGNYIPAIKLAEEALLLNKRGTCVLQLLFLSDGAPSDKPPRGFGSGLMGFSDTVYHSHAIGESVSCLARQFGSRLSVGAFAVGRSQVQVLKHMVSVAASYNCQVFLSKATLCVNDLSSAFRSMTTLLTNTKTAATDLATNRQRTFRDLIRESKFSVNIYNMNDGHWNKYCSESITRAYFDKKEYKWVYPQHKFNDNRAVGLVVRDEIFGEGKERAVRRVREINQRGQVVGPALVGKESLYVEDKSDSISFHKTFCKVQQLSQNVAHRFNRIILQLPGVKRSETPLITFLDCYVMLLPIGGLLVEKMLDHTRYKKFNSNDGYVDGMTVEEYQKMKSNAQAHQHSEDENSQDCSFDVDDIPQAFSHFSYIFSKRRFLVCDLQGVLDTDSDEPLFELTDPVIHYSEMTDRADFGRTDRGQQGIDDFFKSHKCSGLCHMLIRRWIPDPLESDVIRHEYVQINEPKSDATESDNSETADSEVVTRKAKRANTVKFAF